MRTTANKSEDQQVGVREASFSVEEGESSHLVFRKRQIYFATMHRQLIKPTAIIFIWMVRILPKYHPRLIETAAKNGYGFRVLPCCLITILENVGYGLKFRNR